MKKQLFSLLGVCTIVQLMFSCEGPAGPTGQIGPIGQTGAAGATGSQGPAGTNGLDGKDGVNGIDGKIEAKATGWLNLDFEGGKASVNSYTQNGQGTDYYYTYVTLQLKDKNQAFLTKQVLDNGLVLTYFKVNNLLFDETESAYSLVERIVGGTANAGGTSSFKIDGRTTNTNIDFATCTLGNYEIGEMYWNPTFTLQTPYSQNYVTNQWVYTSRAPELLNKTASFYRELAKKSAPKIRLVVIPLASAGRMKAVDFTNYELVKQTFNLKD